MALPSYGLMPPIMEEELGYFLRSKFPYNVIQPAAVDLLYRELIEMSRGLVPDEHLRHVLETIALQVIRDALPTQGIVVDTSEVELALNNNEEDYTIMFNSMFFG